MEKKQDGRRDVVMTDVEDLVPKDHLLRKIENFSRFGRILLLFSSTIFPLTKREKSYKIPASE